jgi:D-3-phosphoglycerate dehydrogenase / 2-oxoglutarate reductase
LKIAFIDSVHPLVSERFEAQGWRCDFLYQQARNEIKEIIHNYDGIILRSRIKMDEDFLKHAKNLNFIGRPGAGLENIDLTFCEKNNIQVFRSPEGNCDAVGEHALGMLLMLLNNLKRADSEVRQGIWRREENRGYELKGKTVAIIGYGYMGKAFAKKLKGFEVNVIAYDKYKQNFSDEFAKEVSLDEIFNHADVVSLHTPQTEVTIGMVNELFLSNFKKPIYFVNTARGKSVITKDLISAIHSDKVLGACLDVLEHESSSFEEVVAQSDELQALTKCEKIIFSPHIAGWTHEAQFKMADVLCSKILNAFGKHTSLGVQ